MAPVLTLRPSIQEDEALACQLHRDELVARFLWTSPRLGFQEAREWFANARAEFNGTFIPAILEDGKVVGFAWYTNCDGHNAMLSIALVRHRGKGLGVEATKLALEYAFKELGLHRVSSTVVKSNKAALALADRFGRLEGEMREAWPLAEGRNDDVLIFGLLKSEWEVFHG